MDKDKVVILFLSTQSPYNLKKLLLVEWTLVGKVYMYEIIYKGIMEEEKKEEIFSLYLNNDQCGMTSLEIDVGLFGLALINFAVVTSPSQFHMSILI